MLTKGLKVLISYAARNLRQSYLKSMNSRRKKLLFQSQHCGWKENDFLLGCYAVEVMDSLSEADLDAFEALLRESDNDIYNWVTEREPLPPHLDNAFMAALITFNRAE